MVNSKPWFWLPQVAGDALPATAASGLLPWLAARHVVMLLARRAAAVPWVTEDWATEENPFYREGFDGHFLEKLRAFGFDSTALYIFGTCSFERAVATSWDAFGVNIFDLPWATRSIEPNTKAIRYVPVLRLPDLLCEADRHGRYPKPILDAAAVKQQLLWAKCHVELRRLWMDSGVCHGDRDQLQLEKRPAAGHIPPSPNLQCPQEGNVCHVPEVLGILRAQCGQQKPPWDPVREVANLDCQRYKLAQVLTLFDSAAGRGDPEGEIPGIGNYHRIIIVEDNEGVRQDLGCKFLEQGAFAQGKPVFSVPGLAQLPEGDVPKLLREEFLRNGFVLAGAGSPNPARIYRIERARREFRASALTARRKDFLASWRKCRETNKLDAWLLIDPPSDREFLLIHEAHDGFHVHRQPLAFADPSRTLKNNACFRSDGSKIKVPEVHDGCPGAGTLFCLDLELGKEHALAGKQRIPGGLFLLYRSALDYRFSSRIVVTGFRQQDLPSFNAGAAAFLLKPFATEELASAVPRSLPYRAVWICPDDVQADWTKHWPAGNPRHFRDSIVRPVAAWGAERGVALNAVNDAHDPGIAHANVVLLDLFPHPSQGQAPQAGAEVPMLASARFAELALAIRMRNPDAQVITLLPLTDSIFGAGGLLETHGRVARDERDSVAFKPLWLFSDCPTAPSIGQCLLSALQRRPRFDVKYVAITPLMGLVWAKSRAGFLVASRQGSTKPKDWAPFVVLIGQVWGMQLPVRDLLRNPNLGLDLLQAFEAERDANKKRWENKDIKSAQAVERFVAFLHEFHQHWTAETWLHHVLDAGPFTRDVTLLFGGETRLSFGSRGAWYDDGHRVEDMNLVVEFCGRRGLIGREAIRAAIVNYLKDQGAEEMVLFQEIPLHGFLE